MLIIGLQLKQKNLTMEHKMSLVWLTDVKTQQKVALNPKYIVAVFTATEGEAEGKTVVGLINGNIIVEESDLDVVGMITGA